MNVPVLRHTKTKNKTQNLSKKEKHEPKLLAA